MANLKQAVEYAAQNPNSDFAKNLSQLMASGSLDQEAKTYGLDTSLFKTKPEPSIANDLTKRVSNIAGIAGDVGKTMSETSPFQAGGVEKVVKKIGSGIIQGLGQVAGGVSDVTVKPIMGGVTDLAKGADTTLGGVPSAIGKAVLNTELGQKGLNAIKGGAEAYAIFAKENPETAKNLEAINEIATMIPLAKPIKAGAELALQGAKGGIDITKSVAGNIKALTPEISLNNQAVAENLMNKVARVTPKEAQDFNKITGKSIGQYLAETGNFEAPDKIIVNEVKKFALAKEAKDTTLASLQGNFKNGSLSDAVEELLVKAEKTSGKNVKSPYLNKVSELKDKLDTEGLTMAEINELKRLYESQVKLGYNKTLNPDLVERATNIDKEIVKFQDKTAKKLGFSNLPELNKQIQASKFIADKLGSSVIKNELLNNVSLTDWVLLSGGNPANIAGLLTKKLFSSKGVQAKIAKTFAKKVNLEEIKAVIKN